MCVRKTLEAGSLVVLSTRQCRLLLNKYGLRVSLLGNSTPEIIVMIWHQCCSLNRHKYLRCILLTYIFLLSTVSYILHIVLTNKLIASFLSNYQSFSHGIDRIYLKLNPFPPALSLLVRILLIIKSYFKRHQYHLRTLPGSCRLRRPKVKGSCCSMYTIYSLQLSVKLFLFSIYQPIYLFSVCSVLMYVFILKISPMLS